MNNKMNKIIPLWMHILIAALVLALGASGCQFGSGSGNSGGKSNTGTKSSESRYSGNNDEVIRMATSEILYQALAENRIDRQTTAKYIILDAFELAEGKVPAEYRGGQGIEGSDGVQYDINWARQNWSALDGQTQKEIKPYVVSVDDPESIFYIDTEKEQAQLDKYKAYLQALPDIFFLPVNAEGEGGIEGGGNGPVRFSTVLNEGAAQIYYYDAAATNAENQAYKEKAEWVKDSFVKSWPVFKGIFGKEPDNAIRVYLRDFPQGSNLWGTATWTEGRAYEIVINRKLDKAKIQATGVHELFHVFQYAYDISLKRDDADTRWLMESTAVWSEDLIYPQYNTEHRFTDAFFEKLAKDRVVFNGRDEYSSFMLFFFLQQFRGHIDHISEIFRINKAKDSRESVMTGIPAYENAYAEFARYNWNQDVFKLYFDNPAFPDTTPHDDSSFIFGHFQQEEKDMNVSLNKGAILYHFHEFSDSEGPVQKVTFKMKGPDNNRHLKVQALIKENGVWRNEYWDLDAEKEFCRKNPATRLNSVVLIFSNSDLKQVADMQYSIDTTGICEEKTIGTTRISGSAALSGLTGYEYSFVSRDNIQSYDNDNPNGTAYVLKSRSMNYTSSGKSAVEFPGLGLITSTVSGTGVLDETYNLSENKVRLVVNHDGSVTFKCDPLRNKTDWVTYISASGGATSSENKDIIINCEAEFTIPREEVVNKRISGSKTFNTNSAYGVMKVIVEYDYQLP